MGGGGGGRNKRLEQLQQEALEEELRRNEELEFDLEARRRLRSFGGRRVLSFFGPRRNQPDGRRAPPTTKVAAPAPSRAARQQPQRQESGGRGGDAGQGGGDAGSGGGGGGGAGGGTGCFVAGTHVMTPDLYNNNAYVEHGDRIYGLRDIEGLDLGDRVMAYDRNGELVQSTVISLFRHFMRPTVRIAVSHGLHLTCTREHPFKVPGDPDEFLKAGDLRVGDSLLDDLGNVVKVTEIEDAGQANVFNIEVAEWNTYIANGVRVHNADKG